MPVEGFDEASKSISKRGSARRKASRDANSKRLQQKAENRDAAAAAKKAKQSEFNTYATPGQKRKAARNSSVNKEDVIAKGKAAEAAKQAKKKPTTQESLLNIQNKFVGFNPFEEANKSGNITKTTPPKVKAKVKPLDVKVKKAVEIKTTPAEAPKLANTTLQPSTPKTEEKAYQKKGTMGKGKAPRINAKPKKRAAKGSRAATLKKGFGY
jgi:hypothetical protein